MAAFGRRAPGSLGRITDDLQAKFGSFMAARQGCAERALIHQSNMRLFTTDNARLLASHATMRAIARTARKDGLQLHREQKAPIQANAQLHIISPGVVQSSPVSDDCSSCQPLIGHQTVLSLMLRHMELSAVRHCCYDQQAQHQSSLLRVASDSKDEQKSAPLDTRPVFATLTAEDNWQFVNTFNENIAYHARAFGHACSTVMALPVLIVKTFGGTEVMLSDARDQLFLTPRLSTTSSLTSARFAVAIQEMTLALQPNAEKAYFGAISNGAIRDCSVCV